MNEAFDAYNIQPVIDTVYLFEQASEAYRHLAKGALARSLSRFKETLF